MSSEFEKRIALRPDNPSAIPAHHLTVSAHVDRLVPETYSAVTARAFARFDAASGALETTDPLASPAAAVVQLSAAGDKIYVGTIFGGPHLDLARIDATTAAVDSWAVPDLQSRGSLAVRDDVVFSAGLAAGIDGIFAADAGTGTLLPWVIRPPQVPRTLHDVPGGLVVAADSFVRVQGTVVTVEWIPGPTGTRPTSYRLRVGSQPGAPIWHRWSFRATRRRSARRFRRAAITCRWCRAPTAWMAAVDRDRVRERGARLHAVAVWPHGVVASADLWPTVTWTAAQGTTPIGYELRAALAPGGTPVARLQLPASTTSFSTVGAPPGTYYVSVAMVGACGMGEPSDEVQVVVVSGPPPPTGLRAQVNGNAVALSWSPAAGATGYVLEAGSASGLGRDRRRRPLVPRAAVGEGHSRNRRRVTEAGCECSQSRSVRIASRSTPVCGGGGNVCAGMARSFRRSEASATSLLTRSSATNRREPLCMKSTASQAGWEVSVAIS